MKATNKAEVTNEKKVTNKREAAIEKILTNNELSKSQKMIELYKLEISIKEISNLMTAAEEKLVRYNFVYNVVSNFCTVNNVELTTNKKEGASKKDLIIELYLNGKSNKEIAIELKSNYNYVFNTVKEYKNKKEATNE